MSSDVAVFDASALIVFHQIGHLDVLGGLFHRAVVPSAVAREVAPSLGELPVWVEERPVTSIPALTRKLDAGEREAIALAMELAADFVVLDDLPGRRVATGLGLTVVGSLGLLIRAQERGSIQRLRPLMDQMIANGLYVGDQLYREILEAAGEAGP